MATKVRDAMTPGVQSIPPTESLPAAAAMMRENDVGSIPVVDGNQLVGILAQADVAMVAKEKESGEMLEEISKPTSTARS